MVGSSERVVAADTFGFLLGTWDVSRVVDDHRSGERWSFEGTAQVVVPVAADAVAAAGAAAAADASDRSEGPTAWYGESGVLEGPRHAGTAGRRLAYERAEGARVLVRFADGRPFVDLDLSTGEWRSVHRCGEDRYEITSVVRDRDLVEERWRVTGPETDYEAVTWLRRRRDDLAMR